MGVGSSKLARLIDMSRFQEKILLLLTVTKYLAHLQKILRKQNRVL